MDRIPIQGLSVSGYRIPTDAPEADGTLSWEATTLVLVRVEAGGRQGLGWSYAHRCTGELIRDKLASLVEGLDALDIPRAHGAMVRAIRNQGRPGISAMAIAAVDIALWDLKGKLLELPLCRLLGQVRDSVPLYGSGGFTSYGVQQLQDQLSGWVADGIIRVKMKVGQHPQDDVPRVAAAREAISDAELFVDANGAYSRKQALAFAGAFAQYGVSWFEEPVSSDDLEGLRLLRDRGPAGMAISAGEYGYDLYYFRRLLEGGCVDVLQADATRCAGISGFLQAGNLCRAYGVPFSAHCAPYLHLHAGLSLESLAHLEYFHDHVRIETRLFDGADPPRDGHLHPDLSRPGLGLELRERDAAPYAL